MSQQDVTADDAVVVVERIAAPPDVVFDFLVDPAKMLRWMGTAVNIDPRPGGRFWLDATETGTDIASGTYLAVEPPTKVVFTWGWENNAEVPPGSTTVTITLTPDGDDTVVELRHEGLPGDAGKSHDEGWNYYLGRLVLTAAGQDPGPVPPH